MYICSIIFLAPAYLQVKYDKISCECLSKYYFDTDFFDKFMYGFAIFWFFVVYVIPIICFIVLYTKIVWTLRQRMRSLEEMQQESRILDIANQQLTRTAMAVAIVFIISLSWDSWFYLMGFAGIATYEFNSPDQIVGVFLSTFNSVANPFIYSVSLAIFRKSLKMTLRCGSWKGDGEFRDKESKKLESNQNRKTFNRTQTAIEGKFWLG